MENLTIPRKKQPSKPAGPPPLSTATAQLLAKVDAMTVDYNSSPENADAYRTYKATPNLPPIEVMEAFACQVFLLHFRKIDTQEYLAWEPQSPAHKSINKEQLLKHMPLPQPAVIKYATIRRSAQAYFETQMRHAQRAIRKLVCVVHDTLFENEVLREIDAEPGANSPTAPVSPASSPAATTAASNNRSSPRQHSPAWPKRLEDNNPQSPPGPRSVKEEHKWRSNDNWNGDDHRHRLPPRPGAPWAQMRARNKPELTSDDERRPKIAKLPQRRPGNRWAPPSESLDGTVPSNTRMVGEQQETSFAGLGVKRIWPGKDCWYASFELDDDDLSEDDMTPQISRHVISTKKVEFPHTTFGGDANARAAAESFIFKVEKGCQADFSAPAPCDSSANKRRAPSSWKSQPVWNPKAHCQSCTCTPPSENGQLHCRTCVCSKPTTKTPQSPTRKSLQNGPHVGLLTARNSDYEFWDNLFAELRAPDEGAEQMISPLDLLTTPIDSNALNKMLAIQ